MLCNLKSSKYKRLTFLSMRSPERLKFGFFCATLPICKSDASGRKHAAGSSADTLAVII